MFNSYEEEKRIKALGSLAGYISELKTWLTPNDFGPNTPFALTRPSNKPPSLKAQTLSPRPKCLYFAPSTSDEEMSREKKEKENTHICVYMYIKWMVRGGMCTKSFQDITKPYSNLALLPQTPTSPIQSVPPDILVLLLSPRYFIRRRPQP